MKKQLFLFLFAIVASIGTLSAWDYTYVQIGDLYYNLNSEGNVAEVILIRASSDIRTVNIPASVKYNSVSYSVTSIGSRAFGGSALTSVTIPNSVTSIGDWAFSGCSSLTSVTIGNSVTSIGNDAFSKCRRLTSVTIPNSVTSIGDWAFYGCSGLTSVTIGNSVTSIGDSVFLDCNGLTSIYVDAGNPIYDSRGNCNGIVETATNMLVVGCKNTVIPSSVTSIGQDAFKGCGGLTSIDIPNSVTNIGFGAFSNCGSLTSVTIGNGVISIGWYAFAHCCSLTSISVESGNTVYDSRENCNAIIETASNTLIAGCQNTVIPSSVTRIGDYAFALCCNDSLSIPNSVTGIGSRAFWGSALNSVTIPNSVTSIGDSAFQFCDITSVTIPNSVTSIGEGVFSYCNNLLSVTIPNSVTSIGNNAFRWSALASVTIPSSVTSIGNMAFYECGNLRSITCEAVTPPALGDEVFENVPNLKSNPLYVPAQSISAYKTAQQWKDFNSILPIASTLPSESAITVRLDPQSCSNWSVVRLWAWTSNGNLFNAWPGIVISQDDNGWYSYTFAENIDNVNIIWTDGTNQTIDITDIYVSTCYALNSTSGKNITVRVVECPETSETYTITFLNYDGTELQVLTEVEEGEMPVYTGETPTRPADSQYTYTFSGWTPEITEATEDATYTATFSNTLNIYTISANAINGEVEGTGEYAYGTEVELTAIPDNGYGFAQWSDGVIDNPRTIIVTGDAEYTALFVQGQGVEDVYVSEHVKKLIIDDKMYILRNGKTYTVTGMKVE